MNGSPQRLLSLFAIGALALAACGGDDDAATVVSAADGASATSDTATSVEEASADGVSADGDAAEGDADSEYCKAVRGEIDMPADFGAMAAVDFTDAEAVEAMLAAADANLSQAVSMAPEVLRDDFQLVMETSMSMISQLAENGGDFSSLDPSTFDNPEVEAAAKRVEAYSVEVCGYDASAATIPVSSGDATSSATIEAMLAPLKAELNLTDEQVTCVSDKLSSSMEASEAELDMAGMMTAFTECGINPDGG